MKRESWRNHAGFALAAMGSAIGLASIVRFPYMVADHGGAAFIVVYLLSLLIIGIPILLGEVTMGRATQKNPYGAFSKLGKAPFWKAGGAWVLMTAFLVSAFYSALSGWICGYLVEAVMNNLSGLHTSELATSHFKGLLASPLWALGYHFVFLTVSVMVVYAGLRDGIERGCKVMMPLLLVTLLLLVLKGITLNNSSEALHYLFTPDWSQITPSVVLLALGQSFFSLSLGQGTMITYGSYLPKGTPFAWNCIAVALSVALISIMASIAVFTIVFSAGMEAQGGLGLMFQTLPVVFSNMAGGYILGSVFFVLVALAALTSEISALEPAIAFLVDERGWTRKNAAIGVGTVAFLIGVPCALSTNILANWTVWGSNILELFDLVATTILVPIGGLLGVLLVAWRWGFGYAFEELTGGSPQGYEAGRLYWKTCLKYLAPALILVIFFSNLGFFGA